MANKISGIHHITAIVGDAQQNVDFYAGVLGLRLTKKTINFDDPGTYHLYFGNSEGAPGTIMTFFPWGNAYRGRVGDGQVGVTAFAVPPNSLEFWKKRLTKFGIPFIENEKFNEKYIGFEDPHGLLLELVERSEGENSSWDFGEITGETAIKGFAGALLFSANAEKTWELLESVMGLEKVGEEGNIIRFKSTAEIGNIIDVMTERQGTGQMGVGTVHHIAWRAEDDADQLDWKEKIENWRLGVTPVQDRNYFNSIYFREYGDILFEIATDPPGFAVDEPVESLGQELKLPPQYEQYRKRLSQELPPLRVRTLDEDK
ncbi:ring-cleaving dioxygenase [Planococcus halotolerans]|uniref:Ring-cleaving dioxygenase n=1 Tax=Planococcus halotolerans TaxID=2233542 RepID=A0A365KQE9_9BACL|nr:ring-cleaving dioxygenase [Planococcus halotolerans]QHJ69465.1 ring-cleaving dioxygenase [Planococcus halotolerans]RAZ75417.1 ring-cleaving dioxygenase [Planococcus halotolerans]